MSHRDPAPRPAGPPASPMSGRRLGLIVAFGLTVLFVLCWLLGVGPGAAGGAQAPVGTGAMVFWAILGMIWDLALAGLILLAALSSGLLLLRLTRLLPAHPLDRVLFGTASGLGLVAYGTLLLGTIGAMGFAVHAAALLVWSAAGSGDLMRLWRAFRRHSGEPARAEPWSSADRIFMVFAALAVCLAVLSTRVPVVDYDSLEYHLASPAHHLRAGRIGFWAENVYANFPEHLETLYLLGMILGGGAEAGLPVALAMSVAFGLLAAAALYRMASWFWCRRAGLAAGVFLLACPFTVSTVFRAYDTLAVTAYSALAFYAVLRWIEALRRGEDSRWHAVAGVMAGLGVATKYTALLLLCLPLGLTVLAAGYAARRCVLTAALRGGVFALTAFIAVAPWFARSYAYTRNPTYPLLYGVFGGKHWSAEQAAKFAKPHRPGAFSAGQAVRQLWRFVTSGPPGRDTGPFEGDFVAGAAVVFIPYMLLLLHRPRGRLPEPSGPATPLGGPAPRGRRAILAAGAAGFFAAYWLAWFAGTQRIDRFLAPAVFALCILSAVGYEAARRRRAARAAVTFLACAALVHALFTQAALAAGAGALTVPFGAETRDIFFKRIGFEPQYLAMRALNDLMKPGDVALFVGEAQTYYCERPCVAPVVFNRHPLSPILETAARDPDRAVRMLREQGFTHLLVNWSELNRLAKSYAFEYQGRQIPGYLPEIDYATGRPLTSLLSRGRLVYPVIPGSRHAAIEIYEFR